MWRKYLLFAILLGACVGSLMAAELYRYQNEAGITVVDWVIPAAYVSSGYEILNGSGRVVRAVPPEKTDTDFERDAAAARAQDAEAVV